MMAKGDGGFSGAQPWDSQGDVKARLDAAAGTAVGGPRTWDLRTWADLEQEPKPIEWAIKGYMEQGTFSVYYGPPGSAKSYVAIDVAACLATGNPWHGNEVAKGLVLYCGGEGPQAFARRLRAWRTGNGVDGRGSPFVYLSNRIGLHENEAVVSLADAVAELQEEHGVELKCVVVDTWQRHIGADENSTADVSAACENLLQNFRDRFNAALLVLHHTGWGETARMRGSRVLQAECDALFQIQLDRDNHRTSMVCERMRDGEMPDEMVFKGESIDIAPEGARDIETAWYLKLMPGRRVDKVEHSLGEKERAILALIRRLYIAEQNRMMGRGQDPEAAEVLAASIRSAIYKAGIYSDDDRGSRAAGNVVRRLLQKKMLRKIGRNFIPSTV